ncbi:hypothetical protein CONPUDRAFT_39022, partial [Coniophora puteana RWD-64-598 SS2]
MRKTAWSSSSSVPSDFIRPSRATPSPQPKGKVTKVAKTQAPPRSKAIRKLESYLQQLQSSSGEDKDPKGGCFCQAREHQLATVSPICLGCGLVTCELNQPYYACPHCAHAALTPALRAKLVADTEERIARTLADEERAREREVEQARLAAGAFPTLGGGGASTPPLQPTSTLYGNGGGLRPPPQQQTHKVLSLNAKTKKHTLATYSASPSPSPSRPASRAESVEEEPHRVPPPLASWEAGGGGLTDSARPFKNPDFPNLRYVPPPAAEGAKPSRRNKGKG